VELYRQIGYFPTESSEHSAEYVPWFMGRDELLDHYRIPVGEYLRRSEGNLAEYEALRRAVESGEDLEIEPTHELASNIIQAIETGAPRVEYVNVMNDGLISNLPAECCVEVPARVDAHGIHPIAVGELPRACAALNRTFLNVVELTVAAALEGDRRLVHQAAILDPNASANLSLDDIHAMCDELIAAHGDRMPPGIRV
jgi:alpha-galactosidase